MDMNLTYGNTVIVLGDNQIPFKQLKSAQQVLMFGEGQSLEDIGEDRCVNTIKNMVLSQNNADCLYLFSCMDVEPSVDIIENVPENEEDDITHSIEDTYMESTKEYHEGYLIIDDKVLKIKGKGNGYDHIYSLYDENITLKVDEEERKYVDSRREYIKSIYERMMVEHNNNVSMYYNNNLSEENKTMAYYYKPLNKNAALAFIKIHCINPQHRYWSVYENAFLMMSNGKILSIDFPFNDILNFIDDNYILKDYETDLKRFKKICKFDNYNIEKYFKDSSLVNDMNEFFRFNNRMWNERHDMNEFFQPTFEMDGYKTYITLPTQEYNIGLSHMKDGKFVSPWSDEYKETEFKRYRQVAYQMTNFIKNGYTGLNPKDGYFYKNGKLEDNQSSKVIYRDAELIEIKGSYNEEIYYGLIKDHFILLDKNDEEDRKLIKEGIDRKKVMSALSGKAI